MNICTILLAAILTLPTVQQKVIPVETDNTQLILQVDSKGIVRTLHYGEKIGNPDQFQNHSIGTHVFRLQGLDPTKNYKVTELNVEKSCWWGNGGTYSGSFLSNGGFNPKMRKANSSAVFMIECE